MVIMCSLTSNKLITLIPQDLWVVQNFITKIVPNFLGFSSRICKKKQKKKTESWSSLIMMKKSWVCTFVTQFSLCLSLFFVLNLCQNQKPMTRNRNVNNLPMDIYFISVTGGIRTLEEQTLLLKQVS